MNGAQIFWKQIFCILIICFANITFCNKCKAGVDFDEFYIFDKNTKKLMCNIFYIKLLKLFHEI